MKMQRLGLLHKTLSGGHEAEAEHCRKVSAQFGHLAAGMAKVDDDAASDAKGTLEALSDEFSLHANDHGERAAHHNECAEACATAAKAEEDELGKVVPHGPSRVAPPAIGITAVLRPGQRDLEKKTEIPPQFQQLVRIEDDEFAF